MLTGSILVELMFAANKEKFDGFHIFSTVFQLTIVHELLEKCCKVQSEADLLKKQYELNAFDISSMDAFKGLKGNINPWNPILFLSVRSRWTQTTTTIQKLLILFKHFDLFCS